MKAFDEIINDLKEAIPVKTRIFLFPGLMIFTLFGAIAFLLIREVLLVIPVLYIQEMAEGAYIIANVCALQILNIMSIGIAINMGFYFIIYIIRFAGFILDLISLVNDYQNRNRKEEP